MKCCNLCGLEKPLSDFYVNGKRHHSRCKICHTGSLKAKRAAKYIPTENESLLKTGLRRCSSCNCVKTVDHFHKKRNSFEGFCKTCKTEKRQRQFSDNPDLATAQVLRRAAYLKENPVAAQLRKEYAREYVKANADKHREWCYEWSRNNPDKRRIIYRTWQQKNPDIVRRHSNARRVAKIRATPPWASSEMEELIINETYHLAMLREASTGIKHHVDHIVPLKSRIVCGLHCAANLRVITAQENLSKSNRYWPDMP